MKSRLPASNGNLLNYQVISFRTILMSLNVVIVLKGRPKRRYHRCSGKEILVYEDLKERVFSNTENRMPDQGTITFFGKVIF